LLVVPRKIQLPSSGRCAIAAAQTYPTRPIIRIDEARAERRMTVEELLDALKAAQ
jgi:hypothetical protein